MCTFNSILYHMHVLSLVVQYTYTCTYIIYTCIYLHTCTFNCSVYTCTYVHVHVRIQLVLGWVYYMYMYLPTVLYIPTNVHVHVCLCKRSIHVHVLSGIHVYTCILVCSQAFKLPLFSVKVLFSTMESHVAIKRLLLLSPNPLLPPFLSLSLTMPGPPTFVPSILPPSLFSLLVFPAALSNLISPLLPFLWPFDLLVCLATALCVKWQSFYLY